MKIIPLIQKRLTPHMKKRGFKKKGGSYYKIVNGIAYCISCERPNAVYANFYVMPLYIPSEIHYLNYGNRVDSVYRGRLPVLLWEATEAEVENWVNALVGILECDIFPFFEKISSPKDVLFFLETEKARDSQCFACTPVDFLRLQLYTYLYLEEYDLARDKLDEYRNELNTLTYFAESYKFRHLKEADAIQNVLDSGEVSVKQFCLENSAKTLANCFE